MMRFSIGLALLALSACSTPPREEPTRAQAPPSGETRIARAADGLAIAYEEHGAGDPTLVLVHGWASERAFWREQIAPLARDHRVLALDLPGHGESGKKRARWSIAGLGADLAHLLEELELSGVVLVGHSMGAPVSLAAAAAAPGRVAAVVAVDALHDVENPTPPELVEGMAAAFERDFEGTMEQAIRGMSRVAPGEELGAVHAWILERARQADRGAALALLRDFPSLDAAALLADAGVPVRAINAAPGPGAALTQVEAGRRHGDFDAVFLDDVGHFLMLERPAELERALRGVLAGLGLE